MITMDDLEALTRSEVSLKGGTRVTVRLEPDIVVEAAIAYLDEYFQTRVMQKTVRLVFSSGTSGHLLRDDFYNLLPVGSRGIGDADGSTLGGAPTGVRFIELCCPVKGCPYRVLTTRRDARDWPACGTHKSKMVRCK